MTQKVNMTNYSLKMQLLPAPEVCTELDAKIFKTKTEQSTLKYEDGHGELPPLINGWVANCKEGIADKLA